MKKVAALTMAAVCLTAGVGIGYAAKIKGPGMSIITGKPAKEAGIAALKEAERLANGGSWELIQIARVYYLSGDKPTGQALLDKVLNGKSEASDWFRIARVYAEAGENAKAEELFLRALASDPKDDSGQAEVGAWYIRTGQREKGEELLAKAFARSSDEIWHYVRAGEAFMGVSPK
ncbi:tetratricopeptide repeat protein [Steroidobacter sp.]|uniref:tetratricopeptide repeat protein n=1 Tax=Steroidobacter sp. TaxID=1978227 RepID=UPI001A5B33DC|nr:tetratricopeptide repeat protein [Steroidobacter sp.]MBL8267041.1 tetratricopeptide repeat protein [Steroidobacter sp.]